jgi:predicted small secreted protein
MKVLCSVLVLVSLAACGTVKGTTAGLLDGITQDLQSLSNAVKGRESK